PAAVQNPHTSPTRRSSDLGSRSDFRIGLGLGGGPLGKELDCPADGVLAKKRSLGAAQDLDPLDIHGVHERTHGFAHIDPIEIDADRKSTRLNSSHVKISYA